MNKKYFVRTSILLIDGASKLAILGNLWDLAKSTLLLYNTKAQKKKPSLTN